MPKIYKINCKICKRYFEGRGKIYCSLKCTWKDKERIEKIASKMRGISKEGRPKGIKQTDEWKKKSLQWKIGNKSRTGRKSSLETRKKQSESHKGEKAYNYKGEASANKARIRHQLEIRLWREAIFIRDDYTCQKCKQKGKKIVGHHIKNFAQYPKLRFALDNGIVFCKNCHIKFHKIYGKENNNGKQVREFA